MEFHFELMQRSQSNLYRQALNKSAAADVVISDICFILGLSKEKLKGKGRKEPYPAGRKVACYFLREYLLLKHEDIGALTGYEDHTMPIYNNKFIKDRLNILAQYPDEKRAYDYVLKGFVND